jgi:serine/threonine protein phosphatase PrpC
VSIKGAGVIDTAPLLRFVPPAGELSASLTRKASTSTLSSSRSASTITSTVSVNSADVGTTQLKDSMYLAHGTQKAGKRKGNPWLAVAHSAALAPTSSAFQSHANLTTSSTFSFETHGGPARECATDAARGAVSATSRMLVLHNEGDDSSCGVCTSTSRSGGPEAERLMRGSVSSRSPSGVSAGTAVPDATRKESGLLELLVRAASAADFAAAQPGESVRRSLEGDWGKPPPQQQQQQPRRPPPEPTVWLRTPLNTLLTSRSVNAVPATSEVVGRNPVDDTPTVSGMAVEVEERRCVGRRWPRMRSPTRRAARSERAVPHRQRRRNVDSDTEAPSLNVSFADVAGGRGRGAVHGPQEPPVRHSNSNQTLSSPTEALQFSLPAMPLDNTAAPDSALASLRVSLSRGMSPSLPRNFFGDTHACAAELPESDMLSVAAATAVTDTATTTSPADGGLDMRSFRTPLSPCPSSVAPPFAVFPCAANSRVTSPMSIPAKMLKQRRREHVLVRNGSASPTSQLLRRHDCQRALRESFGSLTQASVTVGSLSSVFASAVNSAAREVVGCEPTLLLDRSGAKLPGVGCRDAEGGTCALSHEEGNQCKEAVESAECVTERRVWSHGTSVVVCHVDSQPAGAASPCLSVQSAAVATEGPLLSVSLDPPAAARAANACPTDNSQRCARQVGGVPLRIHLPPSGTSTPPLQSPRPTPWELTSFQVSPCAEGKAGIRSPLIQSTPPLSIPARDGSTLPQCCCASPWLPTTTKSVAHDATLYLRVDGTTPTSAHIPSTSSGAGRCSPPLPSAALSTSAPVSGFSFLSHVRDSGARTPLAEDQPRPCQHQQQQQQQQRQTYVPPGSECSNFTPRMSSDDASRRSGRPMSASPVFTASEKRVGGSFACVEQSGSFYSYARLGARSSISAAGVAVVANLGAAGEESNVVVDRPSQGPHPRLTLFPFVEFEPLTFATPQVRRWTPPPLGGRMSTCSTPPPAPLLPSRTSQYNSPCVSPPSVYCQLPPPHPCSAGGNIAFVVPSDRCGAASSADHSSPMCEMIHDEPHGLPTKSSIITTPGATQLGITPRMSRQVLPRRRSMRPSLSPSPSPLPKTCVRESPTTAGRSAASATVVSPGLVADGTPLCRLASPPSTFTFTTTTDRNLDTGVASATDAMGHECYSVESELCGLQSAMSQAVVQLRSSHSADLLAVKPDCGEEAEGNLEVHARSPLCVEWSLGCADSADIGGEPFHEEGSAHGRVRSTDGVEGSQAVDATPDRDVGAVDCVHKSAATESMLAKGDDQNVMDGFSNSNISNDSDMRSLPLRFTDHAANKPCSSATRVSSTLQLAPPPPLAALPRSSSGATSTASSPFSAAASPAAAVPRRSSRRESPLSCADQQGGTGASLLPTAGGISIQVEESYRGAGLCEEEWADAELSDLPHASTMLSTSVWAAREACLPAKNFHYGFSSLRGSRSRQEDSVALMPDLLIRAGMSKKQSSTAEGRDISSVDLGLQQILADLSVNSNSEGGEAVSKAVEGKCDSLLFSCFGVFDGHCGDTVSSLASQYFPEHFEFAVRDYWARWMEVKAKVAVASTRRVACGRCSAVDDTTAAGSRPFNGGSQSDGEGPGEAEKPHEVTSQDDDKEEERGGVSAAIATEQFQRVVSAALVQSLVHLDLTLYDVLHQKTNGRSSAQRRDAGSTASVAAFFKLPHSSCGSCKAGDSVAIFRATTVDGSQQHSGLEVHNGSLDDANTTTVKTHTTDIITTTAAVAAEQGTYRLCIANLGDSRAIVGNTHSQQLLLSTTDHRISACPEEAVRVAAVGGIVELGRIDGSLDVTRGLGDYRYKVDPTRWWAAAATTTATPANPLHPSTTVAVAEMQKPVAAGWTAVPPVFASADATTAPVLPIPVVPAAAADTSWSASVDLSDSPQTGALSTVRALRWPSRSTTPVRDRSSSRDGGSLCGRTPTPTAKARKGGASVGEEDNGEVHNEVDAGAAMVALVATRETEGSEDHHHDDGDHDHYQNHHIGEGVAHEHAAVHLRGSMLSTASSPNTESAAHAVSCAALVESSKHELSSMIVDPATTTVAFTGTARPSPLSGSNPPPQDPVVASLSPMSVSMPASPPQPTVALTGNAVSNIADVYEWEVHRGDVLIMASDGVWDCMSSEEVLRFVCRQLHDLGGEDEEEEKEEVTDMQRIGAALATPPHAADSTPCRRREAQTDADLAEGGAVLDALSQPLPCVSTKPSRDLLRCVMPADSAVATAATMTRIGQHTGTATSASPDGSQRTPLRQPSTVVSRAVDTGKALCTPCGDVGRYCDAEGTPGGVQHGSISRTSVVQAAARRLTEYVVNTLSGSDNTTAIVVVFR